MTRRVAVVVAVLTSFAALAQREDPSRYERFLLPIHTQTSGAFGSQWRTALFMRNESDATLDAFPLTPDCISSIGCFQQMRKYPAFGAQQSGYHLLPAIVPFGVGVRGAGPGVFLYAERAGANELSMQLRVADVSRRPIDFGTRIPVVRERDFFTERTDILAVPILEGTRTALRIYDREPRGGALLTMRIYEMAGHFDTTIGARYVPPELLVVDTFELRHDDAGDMCAFWESSCPAGYRYKPGFVEITDLLGRYPALAGKNLVRIELEPITEGLAFWPMASATENETSVVAIYTAR